MRFSYNYHRDLATSHVSCEKPRAYFIPYTNEKTALSDKRTKSESFLSLCGDWDFRYYESINKIDDFLAEGFATDGFDKMTVPRTWQSVINKGYDKPAYINDGYVFPIDPPHIPTDIPCGLYVRDLFVDEKFLEKEIYINFEGVDSCFYLFVNGAFAGYSTVSHSTSEINITGLLKAGVNNFKVLVLKWCVGSYLEDQDKLRMSGIFREVYLLARDKKHIGDIYLKTSLNADYSEAELRLELSADEALDYEYKLFDPSGKEILSGKAATDKDAFLKITSPELWSDEIPSLYTLVIHCGSEYIPLSVGIREFKIEGKIVYINGKKVKARGVNRHDSHPYLGYATPEDHMWRDLCIMKAHNVNMVRTSHYPSDPRFMSMCDKIGMYVCDETDMETHGMGKILHWEGLTDSEQWSHLFLDRVERMFERDKNHTCVLMWSLGNESGVGRNQRKMYDFIHSRMPEAIVHCEDPCRQHLFEKPDPRVRMVEEKDFHKYTDVFSVMYKPFDMCRELSSDPEKLDIPYFLCEYSHAMGNSPGDLKDYWDIIYAHDGFFGGCVWEFIDHSVAYGENRYADPEFLYGGDFGEPLYRHSGNFCLDGLVYPDRRPSTGLLEHKNVVKPFAVTDVDVLGGKFSILSRREFKNLSDCDIYWKLEQRGKIVKQGRIASPDIAPRETKSFEIDLSGIDERLGGALTVSMRTVDDTPWAQAGYEIGFEQFCVSENVEKKALTAVTHGALSVLENDDVIVITDKKTVYTFDRSSSLISSIIDNGREMLASEVRPAVWRAPTDNDRRIKLRWIENGYDTASVTRHSLDIVSADENKVVLVSSLVLGGEVLRAPFLKMDVTYTVCSGEGIVVDTKAEQLDTQVGRIAPMLPRFGFEFKMPEENEKLVYFGRGPIESYIDKRWASAQGLYETSVTEHFEHYVRPQENMAHTDTEWVSISNLSGHGLAAIALDKSFSFNCSHYTSKQLTETPHDYQLKPLKETVVNIDCGHSGIGSASCGPELDPKYRLEGKNICFSFRLRPTFVNGDDLFDETGRKI